MNNINNIVQRVKCTLNKHEFEVKHNTQKYELLRCKHCGLYRSYNKLYENITTCKEFKHLPVGLKAEFKGE